MVWDVYDTPAALRRESAKQWRLLSWPSQSTMLPKQLLRSFYMT